MATLFIITDKVVFPNPETLLIEPFKSIWERDKSKEKHNALEELAFIEFMVSMKKSNPFRQYPENRKEVVIREAVITQDRWMPDELVTQGMHKLIEFQKEGSTTYNYYMSAKRVAEKMQDFFNEVDITAVNPKTMNPVYKPRDITSALNDTEKVLTNLKSLEKKVEEELFEETKNRADKILSPFADPSSLLD
jgi:hypothetical protein